MSDLREGTEQRGTPEDFMRIVRRRGWVVLCSVGVTVGVIAFLLLTSDTVYQSYSKLLVNRGQSLSAFTANMRTLPWEEELSSEIETIRSARIYQRAQELIDEQNIEPGYKIWARGIDASTPGKSSIIEISYRDHDPRMAQAVVHALTQAYREFRTEERRMDPSDFLRQEIEQTAAEIAEWEQRRADFLVQEGTVDLTEERTRLLETRRNLEFELAEQRAEVADRRARLDWMVDLLADPTAADLSANLYVFGENQREEMGLSMLRRSLLQSKTELFEARSMYTEGHPKVLALGERIEEIEAELRHEAEGYVTHLRALYEAARARESSIEASLAYVNEQLAAFPDREAQLAALDRTIGTLRDNHGALVRRRVDALTTRIGATPWDVVVLQDAVEATAMRTRDYVRLTIIPIFSLLLGLGLAFLLDNLDHSLKDRTDAETHLKVPVLATVGQVRK